MAFRRLRIAALLAGALLTTNALRLVYAADNSCVEARSSAMEKVNNAFNQNIDLFIELSASLKDEGLDPNQYPIIMPDGTVESLDLVDTIRKLVLQKADAVKQIKDFTNGCRKGVIAPDQIMGLADSFSRGVLQALPQVSSP